MWKKASFFALLALLPVFMLVFGTRVLAAPNNIQTEEPSMTPSAPWVTFSAPTDRPTLDFTCPSGLPDNFGIVTPGLLWQASCQQCLDALTPTATLATMTPVPGYVYGTPTPPTATPVQSSTPTAKPCRVVYPVLTSTSDVVSHGDIEWHNVETGSGGLSGIVEWDCRVTPMCIHFSNSEDVLLYFDDLDNSVLNTLVDGDVIRLCQVALVGNLFSREFGVHTPNPIGVFPFQQPGGSNGGAMPTPFVSGGTMLKGPVCNDVYYNANSPSTSYQFRVGWINTVNEIRSGLSSNDYSVIRFWIQSINGKPLCVGGATGSYCSSIPNEDIVLPEGELPTFEVNPIASACFAAAIPVESGFWTEVAETILELIGAPGGFEICFHEVRFQVIYVLGFEFDIQSVLSMIVFGYWLIAVIRR